MVGVQEMSQLVWAMAKPEPRHDNILSTVGVFQWEAWVAVIVTVIAVVIVFAFIFKKERDSVFKAVVIGYTGVINEPVQSSWVVNINTRSAAIMLAFWIPLAFFVNAAYRSQLLSNIVALEYEATIDTSEQVLASKLPLAVRTDGIYYDTFTKNPTPILKAIYEENVLKRGAVYDRNNDDDKDKYNDMVKAGEAIGMKLWDPEDKVRYETHKPVY